MYIDDIVDTVKDFLCFLGLDSAPDEIINENHINQSIIKNQSDKYFCAELSIEAEEDDDIKRQMRMRLALGITDFSDI